MVDRRDNGDLTKSVRNLANAKFLAPEGLNVYDILNYPSLVITRDAVKAVEGRILGDKDKDEAPARPTAANGRGKPGSKEGSACVLPNRSSSARC